MIPQPFDYASPATLKEALALVEDGEAKLLAGGMSLIPLMKLRLAQPERVIDLARIPGLNGIELSEGRIRIGAMATHHELEASATIRAHCPLLGETASQIGDPQVRNRGTLGGSIAHADPAADYPAALLALEARFRLASAKRERTVAAQDFFLDAFTTALEPGEMVVEVEVTVEDSHEGYAYEKLAHPASGFAVVGVAARVKKAAGKVAMARIGVTGLSSHAFRADYAERLLENGADGAAAAAVVGQEAEPISDLYASPEYRLHLARVYAKRAIAAALARAS